MRPAIVLLLAVSLTAAAHAQQTPRQAAIAHALHFLQTFAASDNHLSDYGGDLLWCFYSLAHTSADPELHRQAETTGRELARRWRKLHPHVAAEISARELGRLVAAAHAADLLGARDPRFAAELRQAVRRFTAKELLGFDAPREPPAGTNRYDTWTDALITSYFGDVSGIELGAPLRDVLKWRPCMLPYEGHEEDADFDAYYSVTHIVYALDHYDERRIAAALLPEEFAFIRPHLTAAIASDDPEMVAEALDTLRAAGFEKDSDVQKGMDYLVSAQRPDGTWAGDSDDPYTEYHAAWAGIDALRAYRYRGTVRQLPALPAVQCP